MKLCVDFTSALGDRTGVGTYTRELTRALLGRVDLVLAAHVYRHPGWHAKMSRLLAGRPRRWTARPNRLIPHGVVLEAERLLDRPAAETLFGPCDVFHGTNFLAPRCRRARSVITVHDLAFVRHPEEVPVPHRYRRYLSRAIERADRIIAVSEATRRDVIELFDAAPEKVVTVHEGVPERSDGLAPEEFRAFRARAGIPERFLLFVGTIEPRKNLERLLDAFGAAANRLPRGTGLVLAGRPGWHMERILSAFRRVRAKAPVILTGFVPERVRNSLLANATAFTFPSLYEGFGLPMLEAFAAGAPVVAGDAGALPEVAGGAALLVDPRDGEAMIEALVRIATDEELRARLIRDGRERATHFSWDRAAVETLRVYGHG